MDSHGSTQSNLRKVFDAAAAKSLAVVNSLDAEPEMARFVEFVRNNPNSRQDVVELVTLSFSEDFYMKWPPIDLWRYAMHALRWTEVQQLIKSKRQADVDLHGARCSGVWDDLLEVFDDDWDGAKYFDAFK